MLIRSQKRDAIVHIKSFNCIVIKRLSRDIPCRCSIDAEYDDGTAELGEYESLERAQEVLEKIIEYYSVMKRGHAVVTDSAQYKSKYHGCFDMPAE